MSKKGWRELRRMGCEFLGCWRKRREKIVKLEQNLSKSTEINLSKNRNIDRMRENPFQMFVYI